jgi:hypothetical protein
MRSKLLTDAAALVAVACTISLGSQSVSASTYKSASTSYSTSMYYPWAGQSPWDRPGTVNPDVISGALLSTSTHWPALTDYGFYRPTFGDYCRREPCQAWKRW